MAAENARRGLFACVVTQGSLKECAADAYAVITRDVKTSFVGGGLLNVRLSPDSARREDISPGPSRAKKWHRPRRQTGIAGRSCACHVNPPADLLLCHLHRDTRTSETQP